MLRVSHRDKRTVIVERNIRRHEAPAALFDILQKYRVEQPGTNLASLDTEVREVDPSGWSAVWVDVKDDIETETPIPIPHLPPLVLS